MRELRVEIPGSEYSVWVGAGLLERAHELLPALDRAEAIALISDANVEPLHGGRVRAGLAPSGLRIASFTLEPGEASKDVGSLGSLWRWMASGGLHGQDLVVALGGGVVGDVGGFAAASFHRGVPVVQIPTSLLAQVDASIGGKTAINLPEGKNLVGAFHQPRAVIADVRTLATLPDDQLATGMAEVIKHGFISEGDLNARILSSAPKIFERDPEILTEIVADAASVKVGVVTADPFERGIRAHLNYGHTLAHALETVGGYRAWTHGQAVAVGMMFAAHLAAGLGYPDHTAEHRRVLEALGLPTGGAEAPYEAIAELWLRDKKYEAGVRFVVLEDLGKPAVVRDVPEAALRAAYEAVR